MHKISREQRTSALSPKALFSRHNKLDLRETRIIEESGFWHDVRTAHAHTPKGNENIKKEVAGILLVLVLTSMCIETIPSNAIVQTMGNVADNEGFWNTTASSVKVYTRLSGDINSDGTVDIYDAIALARAFGSETGSPNWNMNADLDSDNIVDTYDGAILAFNFGARKSLKIGIYTASWNFNEFTAEAIASTFDMSQSWWVSSPEYDYSSKMSQVHALNPKYKALVYRNVMDIYNYSTDEWNLAISNGWLLKDSNAHFVTDTTWRENHRVDITNPDYQKWVANKIKSWLDQYPFFDGVMVDNGLKYSENEWEYGDSARPINPRTGAFFTDEEITTAYIQLLNEIIKAVGESKLVLPNGIWNGNVFHDYFSVYARILSEVPQLSGLASEGIFQSLNAYWYTEAEWLRSLNMLVWIQNNFLKGHSERHYNGWISVDRDDSALPPGSTREQLVMYGFCSMMLGIECSGQNTFGFGEKLYNYPNLIALVQKLRSIDMIEPLNDYYKIPSTSVYARDFVKGKVLVNPTDVLYTIALDGSYRAVDGTVVPDLLTVNPHSGILLLRKT